MKNALLRPLPVLTAWLALALPALAGELFPAAPTDQVSVRTLPSFTVVQLDTNATIEAAWSKGFRDAAIYDAKVHSDLNTPTVITFPDWDKTPKADGVVHVQVQCLLDPIPGLPPIHEHGATLESMPGMTVACYGFTGAYTAANFVAGLQKIQAYLQSRNIPAAGPPRFLYYTDSAWVPSYWRVGEVQVPIAAGPGR